MADSTARHGRSYFTEPTLLSRLAHMKHGMASSCAITEKAIRPPIEWA
jgi:hypothetical protein